MTGLGGSIGGAHPTFPRIGRGGTRSLSLPSPTHGGMVSATGAYSNPDHIGTVGVRLTSDDPQILRSKKADLGSEKADWVPEVIRDFGVFVVGTGKIKNGKCGRFKPLEDDSAGACPNKPNEHKPFVLPIGCTRRTCPEDHTRWANKDARRIANSVNGYLTVKFKHQADQIPGFVPRYFSDHVSLHPPRALVVELVRRAKRDLQKALAKPENDKYTPEEVFHRLLTKKYAYQEDKAAAILGMKAWVSIYHPIRLKSDVADRDADEMQDTNRYRDVLNISSPCKLCTRKKQDRDPATVKENSKNDWINHVKMSLHSHLVTDGSFLMDSVEFYKKTGWTYRIHKEITDVERLAKYLLSHAGAVPGKLSVRYLGDYKKLNVEGTIKVETFIACPECIKEGMPPEDSTYVVGKLLNMEYDRDENHRLHMVRWDWGEIYGKHYIKRARIIPIYRMNPAGLPRLPLEKLNGKPLTLFKKDWEKLKGYLLHPLPGCGPWSGISRQDVTRWKEQYSFDEWIEIADDDKPRWWV